MRPSGAVPLVPSTRSTAFIEPQAEPQLPGCTPVLGGRSSSFRFSPVRLRSRCGLIGSHRLSCDSRRRAAVGSGGRSETRYRGGGSGTATPSWAPSLSALPFPPPLTCGSRGGRDVRRGGDQLWVRVSGAGAPFPGRRGRARVGRT